MPIGAQLTDFITTSTTAGNQRDPSVAILADGRIAIVFESADSTGTGVWVRILNADGSASAADLLVNTAETGDQLSPSIAATPDGGYVINWHSTDGSADIFGRIFNDDGPSAVFPVNTTTANTQQKPDVAVMTDGRILMTWEDDTGSGSILGQYLAADGTTIGTEFTVFGTPADSVSSTALSNGRAAVVWYDTSANPQEHVRMMVYDANGAAVSGTPFQVSTSAATANREPVVAELQNGAIVVAWEDNFDVRYRVMNADGTSAMANALVVNSSTAGFQSSPAVAGLADGRFVVAFRTNDGTFDGDGAAIVARLFDASGNPIGDDFVIDTTATNSPFIGEIDVAAMPDGRFIVTWASPDGPLADDANIRARIFDPTVFNGTTAADAWQGGSLDDTINGGASTDTLFGNDGNDVINGDADGDNLFGGAGMDKIFGGSGDDILEGGAGRDQIFAGTGDSDLVKVHDGDDAGGESYDLGAGTADRLITEGSDGAYDINLTDDSLIGVERLQLNAALSGTGGTGIVRVTAAQLLDFNDVAGDQDTDSAALLYVLMGAATAINLGADVPLVGGTWDDLDRFVVIGDGSAETIVGSSISDIVTGLGGDDILLGGTGKDTLRGGADNDVLSAFVGDVLVGELYDGGTGSDALTAGTTSSTFSLDFRPADILSIEIIGFGDPGFANSSTLQFNAKQFGPAGISPTAEIRGTFSDVTHTLEVPLFDRNTLNLSGLTFNNFTGGGGPPAGANDRVKIFGDADNENITGTVVRDIINGGGGNDTMAGGVGADQLIGGTGNNTYVLADEATGTDTITDAGGTDTITSTINRNLASYGAIDNLTLLGTAITGLGNGLTNIITGNAQANFLTAVLGAGGADTLRGLDGSDTYDLDDRTHHVVEAGTAGAGTSDRVRWTGLAAQTYFLPVNVENLVLSGTAATNGTGNASVNIIAGNVAANIINGSGDGLVDTLLGGDGDDIYFLDSTIDVITETSTAGSGNDLVRFTGNNGQTYVMAANVERLILSGFTGSNGTGNAVSNTITGNGSDNTLTAAGATADTLTGGAGNDTYNIAGLIHIVTEGPGALAGTTDRVNWTGGAGESYTLAANVEFLFLLGAAAANLVGNSVANTLTGNAANNTLTASGAAADTLRGGNGNDTYNLTATSHVVIELAGQGTADRVNVAGAAGQTYALTDNVEILALTGVTALNGTGNGLANTILGNGAANTLRGGGNADDITGGGGKDTLFGEAGDDTFIFVAVSDSAAGANRDVVSDFDDAGNDMIDLSVLVNAFIGNAAFSAPGQARYEQSGANVLIQINTVGNSGAESEILIANASLGGGVGQVDLTDFFI